MQKQKLTWLWVAAILQLLTALVHSMSFFAKDVPANETEKQLHELIMTYKKDLGLGFAPTFHDFLMALSAGLRYCTCWAGCSVFTLFVKK